MYWQWKRAVGVVVALGALAAYGQDAKTDPDQPKLVSTIGMSAEIGGGVTGFTNNAANSVTNTGGSWTARLTVGTRKHFGFEAAYIASGQGMNSLGVDNNAFLLSNGLEGNLRFNALTGAFQPYAVVGLAWRHYSLENTAYNTSDVANSDDVGEIPVGLGMAYRYRGFIGDLRLQLRNAFESKLIPNTTLSAWDLGARIGWEF